MFAHAKKLPAATVHSEHQISDSSQTAEVSQQAPARSFASLRANFVQRNQLGLSLNLAGMRQAQEEKLEKVRKVSEGSDYFHGTRSGSLITFHTSTDEAIRGSLLPMGVLLKHHAAVFSGERGNSLDDKAFNKNHLSVVGEDDVDGAVKYAADTSFASNATIHSNPRGFGTFLERSHQLRDTATQKLNELHEADRETAALIASNFPIVYGLKPGPEKNIQGARSDIRGEAGIEGGCSSDEIRVIFVQDEEVQSVKKYLAQCGFDLPVKPISSLPE
jgi:hypothetical protein